MKHLLFGAAALAAVAVAAPSNAATYTYAGSWNVSDGPDWGSQPDSYTGQQAAAFLFGGKASDYAISSVDESVSDIDFNAWYGVLGAGGPNQNAFKFAQDYVSATSTQAPGKYFSGNYGYHYDGTDAASAFVADNVYGNVRNYAFRVATDVGAVPEPATWAMMLMGFGMIGFAARRRQSVKTTVRFA